MYAIIYMYTYEEHIKPYSNKFKFIKVSDNKIAHINDFVKELVQVKVQESHVRVDSMSLRKRHFTGIFGEVALEEYLGITGIVDWTIGNSADYHRPDLNNIGINAGVKAVEFGLFPIVFKKNDGNEIIMIKKGNSACICGLATKDILNTYQSDSLIMDSRLRARGTKSGFYGFEHLLPFNDLAELKNILK
jgi:hypothetical protein